jgi:hypothetical protein
LCEKERKEATKKWQSKKKNDLGGSNDDHYDPTFVVRLSSLLDFGRTGNYRHE